MKALKKFTKVDRLLSQKEQITKADIDLLNKEELKYFDHLVNKRANELKGVELAKFLKHIDLIIDESTKNQLWEFNHNKITNAISTLMQEFGRMPTKTEIATKSELSRQTVHKHLNEYTAHPLFIETREQFRFMADKVLAKVFQFAVTGDMAAAKLYFKAVGCLDNRQALNNTLIQNQNNFIQINNTILSQQAIQQLNTEQLNAIEEILRATLLKPTNSGIKN